LSGKGFWILKPTYLIGELYQNIVAIVFGGKSSIIVHQLTPISFFKKTYRLKDLGGQGAA
jgi:hypothetical protein